MTLVNRILLTLAENQPVTVQHLSDRLGRSVTELEMILDELCADGIRLQRAHDNRLCWADPVEPLSAERIRARLTAPAARLVQSLRVDYKLDSTNRHVARQANPHGFVAMAELQTAGRGRRGRCWISPPCQNLYLSIGWRFAAPPGALTGLSPGVGLKLAGMLKPYVRKGLGLKWPNDLYVGEQKLGGILIELKAGQGCTDVVIGIGINVLMTPAGQAIDQPWTSLRLQGGDNVPARNALASRLLNTLLPWLNNFSRDGERDIHEEWQAFDLAFGRDVAVLTGDREVAGVGAGIDEHFRFRLQANDGLHCFSSGEVSMRLR